MVGRLRIVKEVCRKLDNLDTGHVTLEVTWFLHL